MSDRSYASTKPFLTIEEQLALLKRRGLIVNDEEKAKAFLLRVNYSRLRPYWHPFEVREQGEHRFLAGTTFEDIVRLYEFDRELRLHVLAAIERIEIAMRTRWAYYFSEQLGPFAYLEPKWYRDLKRFRMSVKSLKRSWNAHKDHDPVLRHFDRDYVEDLPPLWLAVELLTFGELISWISNLDRQKPELQPVFRGLKSGLGISAGALIELFPHLRYVRNLAAHHARLWDRKLTAYTLSAPRKGDLELLDALKAVQPKKIQYLYRTLVVLAHLSHRLVENCTWAKDLCRLFAKYRPMLDRMGFPPGWQDLSFWQSLCPRK